MHKLLSGGTTGIYPIFSPEVMAPPTPPWSLAAPRGTAARTDRAGAAAGSAASVGADGRSAMVDGLEAAEGPAPACSLSGVGAAACAGSATWTARV